MDAVVADLDTRRHPFHVAIENWGHDFNIGSVVRTANAFNAAAFHIVGKRRWNRRGAMVTDRYQHELHHPSVADLVAWAASAGSGGTGIPLIGIDNVPGSVPLETYDLPRECVLVLGQEGPGLTPEMLAACDVVLHIEQFGSTRSINAGAAGAIAMHAWVRRHVFGQHRELPSVDLWRELSVAVVDPVALARRGVRSQPRRPETGGTHHEHDYVVLLVGDDDRWGPWTPSSAPPATPSTTASRRS